MACGHSALPAHASGCRGKPYLCKEASYGTDAQLGRSGSCLGSTALGCVSQEKYNALKLDRDQYAQRLSAAEAAGAVGSGGERMPTSVSSTRLGQNQATRPAWSTSLMTQVADLRSATRRADAQYADAMQPAARLTPALPSR